MKFASSATKFENSSVVAADIGTYEVLTMAVATMIIATSVKAVAYSLFTLLVKTMGVLYFSVSSLYMLVADIIVAAIVNH